MTKFKVGQTVQIKELATSRWGNFLTIGYKGIVTEVLSSQRYNDVGEFIYEVAFYDLSSIYIGKWRMAANELKLTDEIAYVTPVKINQFDLFLD